MSDLKVDLEVTCNLLRRDTVLERGRLAEEQRHWMILYASGEQSSMAHCLIRILPVEKVANGKKQSGSCK
jgi:hypothetical protein